jgi:hypothetical protein
VYRRETKCAEEEGGVMAHAYFHNPAAIGKLKGSTQFDAVPDHENPGWFRLRSRVLSDRQLFKMLEALWPAIVGVEPQKFALIHSSGGQHAGLWFHLLPNEDYEPGCHQVDTL